MRGPLILVGLTCLSTCAGPPTRPGGVCEGLDVCPGGTSTGSSGTGGGDERTDGGVGAGDAATDAMTVNVTGQLLVAHTIPLPSDGTGTRPGAGWRIETVELPGSAVVTDATGTFALERVRLIDGAVLLRATPPMGMGPLGAIAQLSPSRASVTVIATASDALERAALQAGVTLGIEHAHAVIQVVDNPSTVTGVSATLLDRTAAQIAYDDLRGSLSASAISTGALGTIAILNVAAPAMGTVIPVRLTRNARQNDYGLFVMPRHVTWVRVPPP